MHPRDPVPCPHPKCRRLRPPCPLSPIPQVKYFCFSRRQSTGARAANSTAAAGISETLGLNGSLPPAAAADLQGHWRAATAGEIPQGPPVLLRLASSPQLRFRNSISVRMRTRFPARMCTPSPARDPAAFEVCQQQLPAIVAQSSTQPCCW